MNAQITILPEAKEKKKQEARCQLTSEGTCQLSLISSQRDQITLSLSRYKYTCVSAPQSSKPPESQPSWSEPELTHCDTREEDMASRVAALLLLGIVCIELVSGRNQEPVIVAVNAFPRLLHPRTGLAPASHDLFSVPTFSSDVAGLLQVDLSKETPAACDCKLQHPGGRKRVRHQGDSVSSATQHLSRWLKFISVFR